MSKRIVIADDSKEIVELLSEILSMNGYEVTTFTNGQAVIESIEGNLPDVILLDINMPFASGFEVLHFLRQQIGGEQTKAILLTGDRYVEESPESHLADVFLIKPIDVNDLLNAI